MAHIFTWHETAVTNPTTGKRKTNGREMFMSLLRDFSYLPLEMHAGGEDVVLVVDLMVVDLGVVLMWDVIDEYDD